MGASGGGGGGGGELAGAQVTVAAPSWRTVAMLAAGLLGGELAAHAQSEPTMARDSSAAGTTARPDPAVLWTYDTGG